MNIFSEITELQKRVKKLEEQAHKPREFVKCEDCNNKIKEKDDAGTTSISNKNVSNGNNTKASNDDTGRLPSKKLKKQAGRQAVGASKKSNGKKVGGKAKSKNK